MKKLIIRALLLAAASGMVTTVNATHWIKDCWAEQERNSGG
jgi:hypothetical protein